MAQRDPKVCPHKTLILNIPQEFIQEKWLMSMELTQEEFEKLDKLLRQVTKHLNQVLHVKSTVEQLLLRYNKSQ